MLTLNEVIANLDNFTFEEQLTLMEKLSVGIKSKAANVTGASAPTPKRDFSHIPPDSEIIGMLRPKDGHIPTDEEIKEEYINYISEKYNR